MKVLDAIKCCLDHQVSVTACSTVPPVVWLPEKIFMKIFENRVENFSKEFLENAHGYNYYKLTAVFGGAEYSTIITVKAGAQNEII